VSTTVKNPRANPILEWVHQVLGQMLRTAEIDMADSVTPNDVDVFLDNVAWAICFSYYTALKTSPDAAIFGQDMPFGIPFVADWHKIGEHKHKQSLTGCSNQHKNTWHIDYDYKVGVKTLVMKEGILCKVVSSYGKEAWTITTVHTNRIIRIQRRTRMERLSIQRVQPFTDDIL
jgi:hypothetical protein